MLEHYGETIVKRSFLPLAVFAFIAIISPTIYARHYGSSEDSIALPIIFLVIGGFWLAALFIEGVHASKNEKKKLRSPDTPLVIFSAIVSIILTFLCAYFFEFKLVGGGILLGAITLFLAYAIVYYTITK
jgi:hypothetical protein